jgi:hypothetical protein
VVADPSNHALYRLDAKGELELLAGVPGEQGCQDGPAVQALFNGPAALAFLPDGTLLVADGGNGVIRSVRDGKVGSMAGVPHSRLGQASELLDGPAELAVYRRAANSSMSVGRGMASTPLPMGYRSVPG